MTKTTIKTRCCVLLCAACFGEELQRSSFDFRIVRDKTHFVFVYGYQFGVQNFLTKLLNFGKGSLWISISLLF